MTTIFDEQMQSLYNQLCQQLDKARYPHDWWENRHQSIAMLHMNSPRLHTELVQKYRARMQSSRLTPYGLKS